MDLRSIDGDTYAAQEEFRQPPFDFNFNQPHGTSRQPHNEDEADNHSLFSADVSCGQTAEQNFKIKQLETFYTIFGLSYAHGTSGQTHVIQPKGNDMFVALVQGPSAIKAQMYEEHISSKIDGYNKKQVWWQSIM